MKCGNNISACTVYLISFVSVRTSVMLGVLILAACISQLLLPSSRAAFTFTLNIQSHTTSVSCRDFFNSECDTEFPFFCLRGPRNDMLTDSGFCPLGKNSQTLEYNVQRGNRQISSNLPWEGAFQLYIEAVDVDTLSNDHIEHIFVNENLQANSGTSPVGTYGSDVMLRMTFQVNCQDDFYGPACTVECRPMNDNTNGHFTCNPDDGSRDCLQDYYGENCLTLCQPTEFYTCDQEDGSLICREGFTNPDSSCSENIDDCADQPCDNQGNCTDLVADYSCACPPGYTGKNCSVDINECLDANCPGNSSCFEDAPGSFQCSCNPGFEGENCTEIDPCGSNPCGNDGMCVAVNLFEFSCVCGSGFTGPTCEKVVVAMQSGMCGATTCPPDSTCQETETGLECSPTTANTAGLGKKVVVIASVLGAFVAAIIILILVILVCLCSRRRITLYKAEQRLSHVYEDSPNSRDKKKLGSGLGPLDNDDDDMALNPIYNQPSPSHHHHLLGPLSDGSTSPVLHVVHNTLYESNPIAEAAIYEQVGSKFSTLESTPAAGAPGSLTSSIMANVAYAPGRSKGQECIDNPVYSVTTSKGPESHPIYSVPRPAPDPTSGGGGKGGYAHLSNSSTPSHASSSSSNTPPPDTTTPYANLHQENIEMLERKPKSEISSKTDATAHRTASESDSYYATPTSASASIASRRRSKEGSAQYNKLEHHSTDQPQPVRLSLEFSTGYQALENN